MRRSRSGSWDWATRAPCLAGTRNGDRRPTDAAKGNDQTCFDDGASVQGSEAGAVEGHPSGQTRKADRPWMRYPAMRSRPSPRVSQSANLVATASLAHNRTASLLNAIFRHTQSPGSARCRVSAAVYFYACSMATQSWAQQGLRSKDAGRSISAGSGRIRPALR